MADSPYLAEVLRWFAAHPEALSELPDGAELVIDSIEVVETEAAGEA